MDKTNTFQQWSYMPETHGLSFGTLPQANPERPSVHRGERTDQPSPRNVSKTHLNITFVNKQLSSADKQALFVNHYGP